MDDRKELDWDCAISCDQLQPQIVHRRDQLADAARDGRWKDVLALVDDTDFFFHHAITVNSTRIGGRSGFGPLHQAACHGARSAAAKLVARGAWLTMRSHTGETPAEVARRRGHDDLSCRSEPPQLPLELLDLETWLSSLITVRVRPLGGTYRMPQLGPLFEHPDSSFWCAFPGYYDGFAYEWLDKEKRDTLDVTSWSRMIGGSGQRHYITSSGATLVEEGFV